MKTISIYFIMLVISACSRKQSINHFVFLIDKTDRMIAVQNLTTASVLHYIMKDKPTIFWNECSVTFSEIGDGRLSPSHTFSLPEEPSLTGDEIHRLAEIDSFKNNIGKEVQHIITTPEVNETSAIFEKIFFTIEQVSSDPTMQNTSIVIFSDFMQNTNSLSLYKKYDMERLLLSDTTWFKSVFTNGRPIPPLTSLSIYCIHTSTSPMSDEIFYSVVTQMKLLLEKHGAKVYIKSGL